MSRQDCPSADELAAFVLGRLSPALTEAVGAHLDVCADCEAAAQALESLSDPVIAGLRRRSEESATSDSRASGFSLPEQLGDYRIVREVGRGGMGVVYEAEQVSLGRRVALKVLPHHALLDPEAVERFRRESRAAARLHHTNIVQVFGTGEQEGLLYFVMQFIPGAGLDTLIREMKRRQQGQPRPPTNPETAPQTAAVDSAVQGLFSGRFGANGEPVADGSLTPLPHNYWVSVARLGIQVAEALAFAHGQNVLHRDIKPSNLLLDEQGTVWVSDFGLAKETNGAKDLTRSGFLVGTLRYAPPERLRGQTDVRGDVYGLGVVLYELLTLRPPFTADERGQLLEQVMHTEPSRPRQLNPAVPYDLETIVLKGMARDPAQRYQTVAELGEDLRRFVDDRPLRARRVTLPEQVWRWARRDPRTAGLIAALVFVLVVGLAGVAAEWWRAETTAHNEAGARQRAEKAEGEARYNLYLSLISQARLEWRLNNGTATERLLDQCEPARRGWEWHYLHSLNHPELFTVEREGLGLISGVAFSPDGRRMAFSGSDPYASRSITPVEVWDLGSGQHLRTLDGPPGKVRAVFSPDGRQLAVSGGRSQLWDLATGQQLQSWTEGSTVAFTPGGRIALGGKDAIIFRDPTTGEQTGSIPSTGGRLTLSPDGRLFAVSSTQAVDILDARTGQKLSRLTNGSEIPWGRLDPYSQEGPDVAFSPDGTRIVVATTPPHVWNTETGQLLHTLVGHGGTVPGVAFSPDGWQIATAGADATVRLWEAESGTESAVLRSHPAWVGCVSFHPDGWCLASGGRMPGDVKLWDLTRQPESLNLPDCHAQAVAFDPASEVVRLVTIRGQIQSREPVSGAMQVGPRLDLLDIVEVEQWVTPANIAVFSGDCRWLAGITPDKHTVKLWDTVTGRELAALRGLEHRVVHVALTPDSHRVAAVDWPGKQSNLPRMVRVWDAATGESLPPFSATMGPNPHVHGAVALSPDGTRLAFDDYTAEGTRVRLIDLASRRELLVLPAGRGVIWCLTFSADGQLLAAGDEFGNVTVWDRTGQQLFQGSLENGIYRLAFSHDGQRLAGVNREQVRMWDVAGGKEVLTLRGTPPRPADGGFNPTLAWSPENRWLAATNWDGSMSVWESVAAPDDRGAKERSALRAVPQGRIDGWHLSQARSALEAQQLKAAVFHLDRVATVATLDLPRSVERGQLFVRHGDWDRAATDFARAFADSAPEYGEPWLDYARVELLRGDQDAYRRLCGRMLTEFQEGRRPFTRGSLARTCTLAPGAVGDPARAVHLGEIALAVHPDHPDVLFSLGLAHYRAGDCDRALARAQEACAADKNTAWIRWPLLALAHHRLGHADEARRWLDKATEQHKKMKERLREEAAGFSLPPEWPDFEVLFREASTIAP